MVVSHLGPELEALRSVGEPVDYQAGDLIFGRGDPGGALYLIDSGCVELIFDGVKPAKRLGPGDLFGELGVLLMGHPRSATAWAVETTRARELDRSGVERMLRDQPALLASLLLATCAYLVESERWLVEDLQRRNLELARNIDYLRRTREELSQAELSSHTDALTGLYNRRCLLANWDRLVAANNSVGLLLFDIDHFKTLNDEHGHPAGDRVLQALAQALRDTSSHRDLPCRMGGDEMAVVLGDGGEVGLRERFVTIFESLRGLQIPVRGGALRIACSAGAQIRRPDETFEALYERTDRELYGSKSGGRGRLLHDGEVLCVLRPA